MVRVFFFRLMFFGSVGCDAAYADHAIGVMLVYDVTNRRCLSISPFLLSRCKAIKGVM